MVGSRWDASLDQVLVVVNEQGQQDQWDIYCDMAFRR